MEVYIDERTITITPWKLFVARQNEALMYVYLFGNIFWNLESCMMTLSAIQYCMIVIRNWSMNTEFQTQMSSSFLIIALVHNFNWVLHFLDSEFSTLIENRISSQFSQAVCAKSTCNLTCLKQREIPIMLILKCHVVT